MSEFKLLTLLGIRPDYIRMYKLIRLPEGGSPSERAYQNLVAKIDSGYFSESRNLHSIGSNPLVRKAYNL